MQQKVAVVYLMWLPYSITYLDRFTVSYKKYPAGYAHDLIILFNGYTDKIQIQPHLEILHNAGIAHTYQTLAGGQDIDAYFYIAEKLKHAEILFLNTFSEINADNWLQKLYHPIEDINAGIVGCSASLQSYFSSVFQMNKWYIETDKSFQFNFRKYKLFLKTIFYWYFLFKPFPNYHIRTSIFLIRRELFLAYPKRKFISKFRAYLFENGRKSITNFILKKRYEAVIVDSEGNVYNRLNCREAKVFWRDDQNKLLISDKQTEIYKNANALQRNEMTKLAWGINE